MTAQDRQTDIEEDDFRVEPFGGLECGGPIVGRVGFMAHDPQQQSERFR